MFMNLSIRRLAPVGAAILTAGLLGGSALAATAPSTTQLEQTHPAMRQVLKKGSHGHWVMTLQADLNLLGYHSGPNDGIFGPMTFVALRSFESGHGFPATGVTSPAVWQDILAGFHLMPSVAAPKAPSSGKTSSAATRATTLATSHPAMRQVLRMGSKSHWVTTLQADLTLLGYHPGPQNGQFGTMTETALKLFQSQHGFPATGVTSPEIWQQILSGFHLVPPVSGFKPVTVVQGKKPASATKVTRKAPAPKTSAKTIDGRPILRVLHVIATAYGPSLQDNYPYGPVDAFGQPLAAGMIAVDPRVIPLKSTVYVKGYTDSVLPHGGFVGHAMDTGGAIKGARIDIFINANPRTVSNFGVEPVTVYVLGN